MKRGGWLLLPLSALGALCLLGGPGGAGCDAGQVHAFSAFRYDPAGDCLSDSGIVDVVSGPDPGSCPGLRCWKTPAKEVFVTDAACDAPLDFTDHTADTVGTCVRALWAYTGHEKGRCPTPDGGAGGGP